MQEADNQELTCCVCGKNLFSRFKKKQDRYFLVREKRYWCESSCYWNWFERKLRKTMELFGSDLDFKPDWSTENFHTEIWHALYTEMNIISWPRYKYVKTKQTCDWCGKMFSAGYLQRCLKRKLGKGWYQPHDRWCSKKCYDSWKEFRISAVLLSSKLRHWKTVPAELVETKMIINRTKNLCLKLKT